MVDRVSTVRKLLFLLFCHVGFVTSQNPHTWRSGGFNKNARLGRFDRLLSASHLGAGLACTSRAGESRVTV